MYAEDESRLRSAIASVVLKLSDRLFPARRLQHCKIFTVIAAIALSPLSGTAQAEQEDWLQLSPASPWVMDYAEDSCALRRGFGEEGQRVYLELRKFSPSVETQMIVTSNDIGRRTAPLRGQGMRAGFLPDSELDDVSQAMGIDVGELGSGIIWNTNFLTTEQQALNEQMLEDGESGLAVSDEERDAREAAISGFGVGNAFRQNFILRTGAMHAPMEAMRTCLDELLTHWGIDAEAHRTLSRPVRPLDQQSWARQLVARYPSSQLRVGGQAWVRVRMMVSAQGEPTACTVQALMSDEDFNQTACRLMMRHARFEPALDAAGVPIDSYMTTSIIYRMD